MPRAGWNFNVTFWTLGSGALRPVYATRWKRGVTSATACVGDISGANRAINSRHHQVGVPYSVLYSGALPQAFRSGRVWRGTQRSVDWPGSTPKNPSGPIPMMVKAFPLM